ncbi:MAG: histidine kinase [Prevotellaceae bacterium]|nr:histidine kinase [Prevotellaceae bacterium]MDO4931043.1 histidine kinase [Prevotellaceae bacterium]
MNRKIALAGAAVVLLLPLMFLGARDTLTFKGYIMRCVFPLTMVMVFCLNYYKIIPQALWHHGKRSIVLSNTVVIVLCSTALAGWHNIEFREYQKEVEKAAAATAGTGKKQLRPAPHNRPDNGRRIWITAFLDGMNLTFAAFVAYSIRSKEHIRSLEKQQQEAEVARQEAELRGLRNQISPHFLLNTLNNIYALAAISSERTQSAVMQLSRLLRHTLYNNQQEMVSLLSEADFIRSYIDLMKLRMATNVRIETDISVEQDSKTMVAPLIFISLVENAFKHGVSGSRDCIISISLKEDSESIVCDIFNSNNPKQSSDHSGHGIGLTLVQQRLESIYPNMHKWARWTDTNNLYHSRITIYKTLNT